MCLEFRPWRCSLLPDGEPPRLHAAVYCRRRRRRRGMKKITWMLCLVALVESAKMNDRAYRSKKRDCEVGPCSDLAAAVNGNCVNECVSAACFAAVYGAEPLEDGEIDVKRARQFTACFNRELLTRPARGGDD
mmetsp:Transcript_4721/g.12164  ORF Transcript_4721/g.12164 Transcript_4721/m.12164 type:complete len:133 (-) Transcript_4721:204-602(-)